MLEMNIASRITEVQGAVAKPHRRLQEYLGGLIAIDQAAEIVDEKDAPVFLGDHVLPVSRPLVAKRE